MTPKTTALCPMNLYVALFIHGLLIMAQFLVPVFTPQFNADQHGALAGCIGALQTLLATYQHMTSAVSFDEPNPG